MSKGTPSITFRMSVTEQIAIKKAAERRNMSMSELIREAIRLWFLEKEKGQK